MFNKSHMANDISIKDENSLVFNREELFDIETVKSVLKIYPNNKTPGIDNITKEILVNLIIHTYMFKDNFDKLHTGVQHRDFFHIFGT